MLSDFSIYNCHTKAFVSISALLEIDSGRDFTASGLVSPWTDPEDFDSPSLGIGGKAKDGLTPY